MSCAAGKKPAPASFPSDPVREQPWPPLGVVRQRRPKCAVHQLARHPNAYLLPQPFSVLHHLPVPRLFLVFVQPVLRAPAPPENSPRYPWTEERRADCFLDLRGTCAVQCKIKGEVFNFTGEHHKCAVLVSSQRFRVCVNRDFHACMKKSST